jgi:FMN phosphatase YigB (HAD superfamily)
MTIIWDLDYTLLDTVKFKDALKDAVTSCGVPPERYEEAYKATVTREGKVYDYDPDAHLELLSADFPDEGAKKEARARIDGVLSRTEEFLYPGAKELLERARAAGKEQILLTLGNEAWQQAKVMHSGLADHFDAVVATGKKKSGVIRDLLKDKDDVLVINDNGREVQEMMAEMPEYRYLLMKGPKEAPEGLAVDEVSGIAELEERFVREGIVPPDAKEAGKESDAGRRGPSRR